MSFGGDIFMGVLNDGTVVGVPKKAAPDMVKNFITVVSNPAIFTPTIYLVPEIIKYDESRTIIHVHISPSAEVHSYKKIIYDRVDDADVKVTSTSAIAQLYIRKQNIFTEKKIYPYATMEDLRLELLPKVRTMAQNHAGGKHPWAILNYWNLKEKKATGHLNESSIGEKILEDDSKTMKEICSQLENFLLGITRRKNPTQIAVVNELVRRKNNPRPKQIESKINDKEKEVKALIEKYGNVSMSKISEDLSISKAYTSRLLKRMQDKNIISSIVTNKTKEYNIK